MTSRDVLQELIELSMDGNQAGIDAWNLPRNIETLLNKAVRLNQEIRQLEAIVERREAEEREVESLLLNLIQQSGIAREAATIAQSSS